MLPPPVSVSTVIRHACGRNVRHRTVLDHTEGRRAGEIMDKQDEYRRNAEYAQQMADGSAMQEDRASWLQGRGRLAEPLAAAQEGRPTGMSSASNLTSMSGDVGTRQKDSARLRD